MRIEDWTIESCIERYSGIKQEIEGSFRIDNPFEVKVFQDIVTKAHANFCIPNINIGNIVDFRIKKVIFNKPATIVYWEDGTKTVVKCGENDTYSKETGLALCFMKKALNNKGNYNNLFRKYIKENEDAEN